MAFKTFRRATGVAPAGPPSRRRFGASAVAVAEADAEAEWGIGPPRATASGVRRGEAPRD